MTFSFSDVYDPVDFTGARLGEARAYNMLKEVSKDASFAPNYLVSISASKKTAPPHHNPQHLRIHGGVVV